MALSNNQLDNGINAGNGLNNSEGNVEDGMSEYSAVSDDLKTLANQGVFIGKGTEEQPNEEEEEDELEPRLTRAAAANAINDSPASPRTRSSIDGPASPRSHCNNTSASVVAKSGPPSPAPPAVANANPGSCGSGMAGNSGRKRRANQDDECLRKSLRGTGVKNHRGAAKKAKISN